MIKSAGPLPPCRAENGRTVGCLSCVPGHLLSAPRSHRPPARHPGRRLASPGGPEVARAALPPPEPRRRGLRAGVAPLPASGAALRGTCGPSACRRRPQLPAGLRWPLRGAPLASLRRAGSCLDPLCVAGGPERRRGGRPARRAIPSTAVRARCVHGAAGRWAPAGASPCSTAGTGLGELLDAHGEASGRERGYAGHSRRGSPALPL